MMKIWINEDGKITAETLFWLFLIVVVGYVAVKFVPPYIDYYMFKGEVDGEIQTAHIYSDEEIVKHIMDKAGERELPIKENDIILERKEAFIEVAIRYKIDVNFLSRYTKTLSFTIRTVKPIKSKTYSYERNKCFLLCWTPRKILNIRQKYACGFPRRPSAQADLKSFLTFV